MEHKLCNDYTLLDHFTYTNISAAAYPNIKKWCDLRGYHCRGIERPDFPEGQPDFAYMKDRKGKRLTNEEIIHYQKIIVALHRQIDIVEKIDDLIML